MRRSNSPLFWLVTVPVVAGLLAGCDGPTDLDREQEIDFRTDRSTFALGDTAALSLSNHGPNPIGPPEHLRCSPDMERLVDGSWVAVAVDAPARGCILKGSVPLEPGKSLEWKLPITIEHFQPGAEYRLSGEQGWFEGEDHVTTVVRSNSFTIDPFLPGGASEVSDATSNALPVHQTQDPPSPATRARTLPDKFTAMAQRVPGGFGGVFLDNDGVFTILLTDPAREAAARSSLATEPYIQALVNSPGGERYDVRSARIAEADYTYDQLHKWLDGILQSLRNAGVTETKSGVNVHINRIVVSVRREAQRSQVGDAMESSGVPAEAVIVQVWTDMPPGFWSRSER